jgi:hypothetical protein
LRLELPVTKKRLRTPTAKITETVTISQRGCEGSHITTRKATMDRAISVQLVARNHRLAELG